MPAMRSDSNFLYKLLIILSVALPALFFCVFFAYPVLALVFAGFSQGYGSYSELGQSPIDFVVSVLSAKPVLKAVFYTFYMALLACVFSVLLGLPLAYAFYRLEFYTRNFWRALVMIPFVLPTTVVGVTFRTLFAESGILGFLHLEASVSAIVVAMVFFNISVVVRIVGTFWQGIDTSTIESARLLGASNFRVFRTITLPALTPSIVSAFAVVFLFCATSFGVVLIMGGSLISTVETQIYIFTTQFLDIQTASILSVFQLIFIAVLLLFSTKLDRFLHFKQKLYGSKKNYVTIRKNTFSDYCIIILSLAVVLVLIVFPLCVLVARSFRLKGEWTFANYINLFTTSEATTSAITVGEATYNSLVTALVAATIAVLIGVMVAFVASRHLNNSSAFKYRRFINRLQSAFEGLFVLPLGISAVTVGFGFLITVNVWVYDTALQWFLVPLAQATVAIPLVIKTILPVVKSIDIRQLEASSLLGASKLRQLFTIERPYFFSALVSAFGLALAVSFGEFGATSFLFRPDGATLPVMIYSLIAKPYAVHQGMAMAGSVVLAIFVTAVMFLVQKLSK